MAYSSKHYGMKLDACEYTPSGSHCERRRRLCVTLQSDSKSSRNIHSNTTRISPVNVVRPLLLTAKSSTDYTVVIGAGTGCTDKAVEDYSADPAELIDFTLHLDLQHVSLVAHCANPFGSVAKVIAFLRRGYAG